MLGQDVPWPEDEPEEKSKAEKKAADNGPTLFPELDGAGEA